MFQSLRTPAALLILALPLLAAAGPKSEKAQLACIDGEKPAEPFSQHDKWGMERYEAELARYKRDHERYLRCLDQKEKGSANPVGRQLDDAMANPKGLPPPPPAEPAADPQQR
ncbi:hypothetical protein D0B54_09370 [Solimonas sp. K1W22B-7]|uniref:hypothetical protein n=1 Tax=Solimonas sp. K1W22B-7 TaxID=2303331 RepID=UPI000E32EC36|nr:hypothetical protein [Solimonas sp. K1W22B-7]AXQ28880.1 hypothetical protein D0B54_09370 [Solimonas sp. K1W22B-7]